MNQNTELQITKGTTTIDADFCTDIQAAAIEFQSQSQSIANLLEVHSKDTTDLLTESPIFLSLLDLLREDYQDWTKLKNKLVTDFEKEHDCKLIDWNLRYDTCALTYSMIPTPEEDVASVEIPMDRVKQIEKIGMRYDSINSVIDTIITTHADALADTITGSVAYKGFLKLKARYFQEFEDAKKALQKEFIPADVQSKVASWSLDYSTGILKYKVQ